MEDAIFVFGILFLTIILPLTIILHFVTRWKKTRELTGSDEAMIEEVWDIALRLEQRVHVLETILDQEAPDWRRDKL